MNDFNDINFTNLSKSDLIYLLSLRGKYQDKLIEKAIEVKEKSVGNKVFLRGLIEYSNICSKNCYYCGIRLSNTVDNRYKITFEEAIECAKFAYSKGIGSLAIQSGEISSKEFTEEIEKILKAISSEVNNELGITLSMGEQNQDTLERWLKAGASRYLLRIESSSKDLYNKIHPSDIHHKFENRIESIKLLQKVGFNTGSGVMIGLPFQTLDNLADDLLFLKNIGIDMVGMGPYIEHPQTPLYQYSEMLLSAKERFDLTINMIACLRILMPDINIAATTAMQALEKNGREKAIIAGANVIMPNITPLKYREKYLLYNNKPGRDEQIEDSLENLSKQIKSINHVIALGEKGDSLHFKKRNNLL